MCYQTFKTFSVCTILYLSLKRQSENPTEVPSWWLSSRTKMFRLAALTSATQARRRQLMLSCRHTSAWGEWETGFVDGFMESVPGPGDKQPVASSLTFQSSHLLQSCDRESQSPFPARPPCSSFSHWISHLQPTFCPPQFQSLFLIPLLLILASVLLQSHEAVSHKAAPLDPFPQAPCPSTHVLLTKPGWQSFFHTLKLLTSNLHSPAVPHPVPEHVQPQHLGAAIVGQVLPGACSPASGVCLVQTEPLEDITAKFLRSIYWTWAKAKDLAKVGLFSHSWHQGRSFSMPNRMSVLQGMDILELID